MLVPPNIQGAQLVNCLQDAYSLSAVELVFLPLGADPNAAVYRVETAGNVSQFLKLKRGDFNENSLAVPKFLSDLGIRQIIPPLPTQSGPLWAELEGFRLILYPFVEGRNGYEIALSERHWRELGAALRRVHAADVPPGLAAGIRREDFSPHWRERAAAFLAMVESRSFADPVAAGLAAFLNHKRGEILDLIDQAERRAAILRQRPSAFVLCHSDLHAGNVLIDDHGRLYIVDWDEPIFAPRERDLMYPGGAQGFRGHTPRDEERLFYEGYGSVEVDLVALAYYRFERIVADIAVYCEELLLSDEGGADRTQSLRYVMSNFEPGGTIEAAYRAP